MDARKFKAAWIAVLTALTFLPHSLHAADAYIPFEGEKTTWHDFDRYDFLLDEETLTIKPFTAPATDHNDIKTGLAGQRRCVVVVPKKPAPGQPWSWRGCYWNHQPQTEVELLDRGFHIAYITANAELKPDKKWDAWYAFLTEKHGLSKKPAFIGMSRGGEYAYTWAGRNPTKVSCIYADNPAINREGMTNLADLAANDVPRLHVCGSIDPLLGHHSLAAESIYQQVGGRISMMIKDGSGHHPHSLNDPKPIADFIVASVQSTASTAPAVVGEQFRKTYFYGPETQYREFPSEEKYITCHGPLFTDCYNRYAFNLPGIEGAVSFIQPKTPAEGKPWVYRSEFVTRESAVDLALLAKGFHIVTGPVPYNNDGPSLKDWNAVYKHFTGNGFSRKPVMEGTGAAAGDAFAWAIANPTQVTCIYAENPILRSNMSKKPLIDNLSVLAKAGVPLIHVCGSLDPHLNDVTREIEKCYKELKGQITVIINEREAHFPSAPKDVKAVVELITK